MRPVDARVHTARERFLADGAVPMELSTSVRSDISSSWMRSRLFGAPLARQDQRDVSGSPSTEALLRAAAPVMESLISDLTDLDAGVLVADPQSVILRRWVTDSAMARLLDTVESDRGSSAAEEYIGTNAVGSVIETSRPHMVTGAEHLAEFLLPFGCVGAPIFLPGTRRLGGVVTMTCRAEDNNPLLAPLLSGAARAIERELLDQWSWRERALLDQYVALKRRRTPHAVVSQELLLSSPELTKLLDSVDLAVVWEHVSAVARGDIDTGEISQALGADFSNLKVSAVEVDGKMIGATLELSRSGRRPPPPPARARSSSSPEKTASYSFTGAAEELMAEMTAAASRGARAFLVKGETGVGKLTVARAVADLWAGVEGAHFEINGTLEVQQLRERLEEAHDQGGVLILRRLELLNDELSRAMLSFLEDAWASNPMKVLATYTPPERPGLHLQRLLSALAECTVVLRPLRERREEIPAIAAAMMRSFPSHERKLISTPALRVLMRAPWPGNLTELKSILRLGSSTSASAISVEHLPVELQAHADRRNLTPIEAAELRAILDALHRHGGNKQAAAKSIGLSRSTLYRKLREYRVDFDASFF